MDYNHGITRAVMCNDNFDLFENVVLQTVQTTYELESGYMGVQLSMLSFFIEPTPATRSKPVTRQ